MKIIEGKGTVTLYEVKCSLCGQKIRSPEKGGCQELLVKHVDNECKVASKMPTRLGLEAIRQQAPLLTEGEEK